jgi:hypothetical protein
VSTLTYFSTGKELSGFEIRIGWGKALAKPATPLILPPSASLGSNAIPPPASLNGINFASPLLLVLLIIGVSRF